MAHDITFDIEDVEQINFGIDGSGAIPSVTSVNGKTGEVVLSTSDLENDSDYQTEDDVSLLILEHNTDTEAHEDIRQEIEEKYTLPTTGIPESDLSDEVKQKLDNSAVNDVEVNGESVVNEEGVAEVTVPTRTSQLTNDAGFLTEHQSLANYALVSEAGYTLNLELNPSTYVITPKLYNKAHQLISIGSSVDLPLESVVVNVAYDSETKEIVITLNNGTVVRVPVGDLVEGLVSTTTFNAHADNPTIHISIADRDYWDSKYDRPETGIPANHLSAGVQASLEKANSAIQEHQSLQGYAKEQWVNNQGFLKEHQSLEAYRTAEEQDLIDENFYIKSPYGIPKSDLTDEVVGSLEKADSALQEIPKATAETLGGIYADPAQATDTQPVRINAQGKLVTTPTGGGGSSTAIEGVIFNGTELQKDANKKVSFNAITEHQSLDAYRTAEEQDVLDLDKYEKPSTGIPKEDLSEDVQESLDLADSAIQDLTGYATENWVEDQGYLTEHQSLAAYRTSADQDLIDAEKYEKPDAGIPKEDLEEDVQASLDLANSAIQSLDGYATEQWVENKHYLTQHQSLANYRMAEDQDIIDNAIRADISDIEGKIPAQATTSNQLADKNFVNSSIATETATFRGQYNSYAELLAYVGEKDNNDYAVVKQEDELGNFVYSRYKYSVPKVGQPSWMLEFTINSTGFTAEQWASISSKITEAKVNLYDLHLADTDIHITTSERSSWNAKYEKPSTGIPSADLATGVVNNSTITLKKNDGTVIGTFTLNALQDKTITLPELGKVDDIQVKTDIGGAYSSVVDNKIGKIDLSGFLTYSDNEPSDPVPTIAQQLDITTQTLESVVDSCFSVA